jgi:hypothetical protein
VPLSWTDIENALVTWLEAEIGPGQVIWANQGGAQPKMPYGTLKIGGPRPSSPTPEVLNSTNLTNPAGQEIEQTVIGHGEITVSCQIFAFPTTGHLTARQALERAKLRLYLPTTRAALRVAGLALVQAGDTQDLTALLETSWQSRAAMDVRFNVVDSMTEKTGYIDTANVTGSAT